MFYKRENSRLHNPAMYGIVAVLMFLMNVASFGQTDMMAQTETGKTVVKEEKPPVLQPVLTEYKGIKIGMTGEQVREILDKKPKTADKDGFYYVFSDEESAQIGLDTDKKVRLISVMYMGKDAAPKFEDVFGKDVAATQTEGGGIYNLVRYPEAGFWVAYNRTAGDNPLVTVTIQKMWNAK